MRKATATFFVGFGLAVALLLAACGGGSTGSANVKVDVKTGTATVLGKPQTVLVDGQKGMTLYLFVPDVAGHVNCKGTCLKSWPILKASSDHPTGAAALKGTFGVVTGESGKQVTYNGVPLYTYAGDKAAGDAKGQGVNGVWFVATSTTQSIGAASSSVVQAKKYKVGGKDTWVLTNSKGMTLYWFKPDTAKQVNCTGDCLQAWPPLTAPSGSLTSADPIPGTLGTIANPKGGTMVTYQGHPLYTYVRDKHAGDTTGPGVGGVWFVVTLDVAPLQ